MANLMEKTLTQAIAQRRATPSFDGSAIPNEDLKKILDAGLRAPSGYNIQPWRFIVVRDAKNKEFLSMISKRGSGRRFTGEFLSGQMQARFATLTDETKRKAAFKKLSSGDVSAFVSQADVILIVFGKKEVWDLPFDTSAAIENIHLATTAVGLSCCWLVAPCIDLRDELKLNEYFGIPEDFKSVSILAIGEHDGRYPNPRPRLPLSEIIFKEKYGVPYYEKEEAK